MTTELIAPLTINQAFREAERHPFEAVYPMPSSCIWLGSDFVFTGQNPWQSHDYLRRWEGWLAAKKHTAEAGAANAAASVQKITSFASHALPPGVNAAAVKQLRDETDEPMLDCRRALIECRGDFAAAKEYLRPSLAHRRPLTGGFSYAGGKADTQAAQKVAALIECSRTAAPGPVVAMLEVRAGVPMFASLVPEMPDGRYGLAIARAAMAPVCNAAALEERLALSPRELAEERQRDFERVLGEERLALSPRELAEERQRDFEHALGLTEHQDLATTSAHTPGANT